MTLDLTIAIPTRNVVATLRLTLESVRPLKELGARIVVVDSDSTDGTPEYATGFGADILSVEKGNMYAAVNAGVEATQTEWVTYLNGDDLIYADGIISMLAQACPTNDVLYGNIDFIDEAGRFLHSWRSPEPSEYLPLAACRVMPVPQQGTLFRRRVFNRLGGFNTAFKYSADFDFFLRAYLAGFHFAKCSNSSVSAFRVHQAQLSQRHQAEMWGEGRLSLVHNPVPVSGWRRLLALVNLRLHNWDSYVVRVLRRRQLRGGWKLSRTLGLD